MFYSNVNKIFLGTDGAASSRVGQILPLRVEGSIPYSAPLMTPYMQDCGCHDIEMTYQLQGHRDSCRVVVGKRNMGAVGVNP